MLNDISAVPSWEKVCSGLFKLFQVDVMKKFTVLKQIRFGSLIPFEPDEILR
jgi:serine/threonine-protein phosphatase 2A activator